MGQGLFKVIENGVVR